MNTTSLAAWLMALSALALPPQTTLRSPAPLTPPEQAVKNALQKLVAAEDAAVLTCNRTQLLAVFAPSAHHAMQEAFKREKYLSAWANARQVRFESVQVSIRTPGIRFAAHHRVHVFAVVSEQYRMQSRRSPRQSDTFGLGIRHDYVLESLNGQWRIQSDDFTDPLNQDTRVPGPVQPAAEGSSGQHKDSPGAVANPAVAYANHYCGAAPGCGNGGRYNPRYVDYNGEGGDCTNFISQALAAAGFRQTRAWEYSWRHGEGSPAWANARRFKEFMEDSGRATLFAHGSYAQLTSPSARFLQGAASALRPGDLISYHEQGRTVHTAIVVGFDRFGYPVVDTHTADRFRVPWDLGWDRHTLYDFWKVHYRAPKPGAVFTPAHPTRVSRAQAPS